MLDGLLHCAYFVPKGRFLTLVYSKQMFTDI